MTTTKTQTTIPTLHHLAHSQSLRILWALEEIHLANPSFQYSLKHYPRTLKNTELLKIHRLGKAPVMTLINADGSSPPPTVQIDPGVLSESQLILEFIRDEYSAGIWEPSTDADKKRDVFFTNFATSTLIAKVDFCVVCEAPAQMVPFPFNAPFKLTAWAVVGHFIQDLQAIFQLMEDALSEEKPYFSGKSMGLADINMSFGMDMAEQRGYVSFEEGKFAKLKGWGERVRSREGYRRAIAISPGGYELNYFGNKVGWAMVFNGGLS
jgi:glutathione S-transferase